MPEFDLIEIREAGTVSIVRFMDQIDDFSHRTTELHEQLSRFVGDNACLKLVRQVTIEWPRGVCM
jgi:hypothetical protein